MFRLATTRLLRPQPLLQIQRPRPLSTTLPSLVKIRSSKPPPIPQQPRQSPFQPSQAQSASPAPEPPHVPTDIPSSPASSSKPFETIISNQSGNKVYQTSELEPLDSPTSSSSSTSSIKSSTINPTPLEPPSPEVETEILEPFDRSKLPSLDIDPEASVPQVKAPQKSSSGGEDASGSGGKRTGAGRKEYVSSIERQRRTMLRVGLGLLAIGGLGATWYLSEEDSKASAAAVSKEGGAGEISRYERFKTNLGEIFDIFNKPAFKVLLPDPLPPPHQRPYTLVIDLEGMLVHSTWDRAHGWRTAKRPGVDYFLAYLSQFYEIVLFTSQPLYAAVGVAEKLDPWGAFIPFKLFRESTRYIDGKVVKDLSYLNRDLSHVVLLDTNPDHISLQPENAALIPPWNGEPNDQGLIDMIPFLEAIGIYNVKDVRPILKSYGGKNIPVEYAKKEAEEKRKVVEEWESSRASGGGGEALGGGSNWLSSMFGSVAAPGASRPNQPMTYLEQKRAFYQKAYQEEQKYWRDHADEFNKMVEEDKKRQMAEMRGSMMSWLPGAGGSKNEADGQGKI